MDEIKLLLQQTLGEETVHQSTERLIKLKNDDIFEFSRMLFAIIQEIDLDVLIRSASIIQLWQTYPEELDDSKDMVTRELENNERKTFHQSVINCTLNMILNRFDQIMVLLANLYVRASCFYSFAYDDSDFDPLEMVVSIFQETDNIETLNTTCLIIKRISERVPPEEESALRIIRVLVSHLRQSTDKTQVEALVDLFICMGEVSGFFDPDQTPLEIYNELMNNFLSAVSGLYGHDELLPILFRAWSFLKDQVPMVVAQNESHLLHLLIDASRSDDDNTLFAACELVKDLAELEFDSDQEEASAICGSVDIVIEFLTHIMLRLSSDQTPTGEAWEPALAAFEALKDVCCLITDDETFQKYLDLIQAMLSSSDFAQRDAGVKLLYALSKAQEKFTFSVPLLKYLIELFDDSAPCVRYYAYRVVRKTIHHILNSKDEEIGLQDFLPLFDKLIHTTDQDTQVNSEIILIISYLSQASNFENVCSVLKILLQKALMHKHSYYRDPFEAIELIITDGDSNQVIHFFPEVLETLNIIIQNQHDHCFVKDIGFLIQCYAFRFDEGLVQYTDSLAPVFIQFVLSDSPFSDDAILSIASAAIIGGDKFSPYLEASLGILFNKLNDHSNSYGVSLSSRALVLILTRGVPVFEYQGFDAWISSAFDGIKDEHLPLESYECLLNLLESMISDFPQGFVQRHQSILSYMRVFIQSNMYYEDCEMDDVQGVSKSVVKFVKTAIKCLGESVDLGYIDMVFELVTIICSMSRITTDLMVTTIDLIRFIFTTYNDSFMSNLHDLSTYESVEKLLTDSLEYKGIDDDDVVNMLTAISKEFSKLMEEAESNDMEEYD